MGAIDSLMAEAAKAWLPPKKMTLSEWSDAHAYLSAESSAQEGRWRTLPYQVGFMDAMTDPTVEQVVVKKSARVGFSKCLNNLIGYHIHQDPCSIMMVQPTEADAEGYSKEEIAPMLRDTPALAGLVADSKSRDSNNTILSKSYPGGTLSMVGANSPRGFRRVSRRVILLDEVSGYPPSAGTEGDQVRLAIRRSEYFWNRKIVMGSTPTNKGACRITTEFEATDQRRYFVPCPHCGQMQYLRWANMRWPAGEPEKAYYVCEAGCIIEHAQKYDMIAAGEWRATAVARRPGLVGYHVWAAYSYSPNATWGQLASEYEEAKGNPLKLKTFVNTVQGETWDDEAGEKVSDEELHRRAQAGDDYDGRVLLPDGVLVVVNGVDVQPDRLELETVGVGLEYENWSLDYRVFLGDPDGPLVWQQLDAYLATEFQHPSGVRLRAARTFVDTGGANTQAVYAYCGPRAHLGVYGIKGRGGEALPPVGAPTRSNLAKIPLVPLGTFALKDAVYGALAVAEPGPGYCHFPHRYTEAHYRGLTAEEVRTTVDKKNFPVREWHKVYDRNEPLDCRVYAWGAVLSLNVNFEHLAQVVTGSAGQGDQRRVRGELEPSA